MSLGPIIITSDIYYPTISGAARFVRQLAEGLSGRGHEVHLVVPSWSGAPVTATCAGVTVHGARSRHPVPGRRALWVSCRRAGRRTISDLLRQVRPGVVHIDGHLLIGRAATIAAGRFGVPIVATNHFMPENIVDEFPLPPVLRPPIVRALWTDAGRVLRRASAVVAPTGTAVRMLAAEARVPSAIAISCGIDLARFGVSSPPSRKGGRILYVGRLDREKRIDDLLKATAMTPGAELDLIGAGRDRPALENLTKRLGIDGRVHFRGRVDDEELQRAYAGADVFCMPGTAELQSLATLEALAAGLPVVGANAAALPHLVRPGVTGWLYPPGDSAALARCLTDLLADGPRRAQMGRAARTEASGHTLDATLDRYESLYRTVAGA